MISWCRFFSGCFSAGFLGRFLGRLGLGFFFHNGFGFVGAEFEANWFVAPNFFQVIVLTDGRLHDVHDHRAAIDNDPLAVFFALHAGFAKAGIPHFIAHACCQGLGLAVRGAAGNDDPLEQGRQI